jgi:hypothetical protein
MRNPRKKVAVGNERLGKLLAETGIAEMKELVERRTSKEDEETGGGVQADSSTTRE